MKNKLDLSLIKEISFSHEYEIISNDFGIIKLKNVDEFISDFDERLKNRYLNLSTLLISIIYWLMALLVCLSILNFKLYILSFILLICFSIFYMLLLFAARTYFESYDVNVYTLLLEALTNKGNSLDIKFSRDTINTHGRGWSDIKYLSTLYFKNINIDFDVELDSTFANGEICLDIFNHKMIINKDTYLIFTIRDIHHV